MVALVHKRGHWFTSLFRKSFRIVVFVCMFASTWRAPVPWLHRHSDVTPQDNRLNLALHLTNWHATGDHSDKWHVHFALLDDILRGSGDPVPPSDDRDRSQPLVTGIAVLGEHAPLNKLAPSIGSPVEGSINSELPDPINWTTGRGHSFRVQFLSDFAISGRLQSLLRVAQC